MPRKITAVVLVLLSSLLLSSCASLPKDFPRQESWKIDAADTRLASTYSALAAEHPGQSGAVLLGSGIDALAARIAMIQAAERSLDVQYYIWHNDDSGRLLLKEMLDAADRGVRVRLLLDDIGVGRKNDDIYVWLDSHPNFSVALFNPIGSRDARALGTVADPVRLNHRMHNKSMTADSAVTIVGGRNIGDEYFSLKKEVNFADMDVLAVGPVANRVSDSFDIFWNAPASIPIGAFHHDKPDMEISAARRDGLSEQVNQNEAVLYRAVQSTHFSQQLPSGDLAFFWGPIAVFHDMPEKSQGDDTSGLLLDQLHEQLGKARSDLLIVSPYFVPGKPGVRTLVSAVTDGAQVRIVTNSLASTDVAAVHAGYKKYRRSLLEGGVELYELMPSPVKGSRVASTLSYYGSSGASLHAKTFVIDRQWVFIGSMNLDPRSVELNTEIGLLIENPDLANELEKRISEVIATACYTVALEPKHPGRPDSSERLVWIEHRKGEDIRYYKDPQTTFWQRFKVGLIGLFPLDSQL